MRVRRAAPGGTRTPRKAPSTVRVSAGRPSARARQPALAGIEVATSVVPGGSASTVLPGAAASTGAGRAVPVRPVGRKPRTSSAKRATRPGSASVERKPWIPERPMTTAEPGTNQRGSAPGFS